MAGARSVAVLAVTAVLLTGEPKFQLTVDSIMRGPGLAGHQPLGIRWSGDGERVYFEWKLATAAVRSDYETWVANRDGSGLRKLTRDERKLAPPPAGDTSLDRRITAYEFEGDIYVYDRVADKARALTATVETETSPQVTRDGKRVAFTRSNNLFVVPIDGGTIVQLTDIQPPGAPVPPDEKKGTASQEYLKKQERSLIEDVRETARKREEDEARKKPRKPLRLATRQTIELLALSPDEKTVTALITEAAEGAKKAVVPKYVNESAYTDSLPTRLKVGDSPDKVLLALIDVATGEVKYVDAGMKERQPMLTMPQWSDDGSRAYVTASSLDNKDWWLLGLDPADGKTRVLANNRDEAWVNRQTDTGWMKGDREIYFLSERDGANHLYTVSWEGGEPKRLTSGRWEIFAATLSRHKDRFFLETNEAHPGERQLYSMPAGGGDRTKLTGTNGLVIAFAPQSAPALSPDERSAAVVYSYVNKPPELYVQPLQGGGPPVKITTSPLPEFFEYAWQDAPIVSVPASDGVNVPGRLYKPRNARRGGPAVIFVHGAGYLQNIHKGWSQYYREYMFHHILMERGYTVLDIDYRGSAGYGRDWRTAIYRHMGGRDLADHVDAAKWLVAQHGADPARIGIYGGSYGGFITLMAMFKHPDVFAAGAALRPVTDWAHYNHGYTSAILNTPHEDAEAFKRSSPIYFAEGLKGALLMCHGLVDVNVHAQDTIRLAQRLIELRKENWEMALYPVEDHAFIQPTSWADEYRRILTLFERNLKRQ